MMMIMTQTKDIGEEVKDQNEGENSQRRRNMKKTK